MKRLLPLALSTAVVLTPFQAAALLHGSAALNLARRHICISASQRKEEGGGEDDQSRETMGKVARAASAQLLRQAMTSMSGISETPAAATKATPATPTFTPPVTDSSRASPLASHTRLAHLLLRQAVAPGDAVLDCTAGNGHDSVVVARECLGLADGAGELNKKGRAHVMDIQQIALDRTRERLNEHLPSAAMEQVHFYCQNFRDLPDIEPGTLAVACYNLGYLPGGDKSIVSTADDTLSSVKAALKLLKPGGMISVMMYCYHGEAGETEKNQLLAWSRELPHNSWRAFTHAQENRQLGPVLLTIYRL
ncbi:unnamed protein product [Chrysoparadoxa australica]